MGVGSRGGWWWRVGGSGSTAGGGRGVSSRRGWRRAAWPAAGQWFILSESPGTRVQRSPHFFKEFTREVTATIQLRQFHKGGHHFEFSRDLGSGGSFWLSIVFWLKVRRKITLIFWCLECLKQDLFLIWTCLCGFYNEVMVVRRTMRRVNHCFWR